MARANAEGQRPASTYTTTTGVQISRNQLLLIMAGVMLGVLLAALDQTVVGPAMFKIVTDLKGLEHYAWVATAYMLTSTVSVPIAGKLGDLYGRKWFFVAGIIIFLAGSALSGLSSGIDPFNLFGITVPGLTTGMAELIGFRALQGLGGGLMFANAFTIIGDLVPPAERGRWQGMFGAVWGLASVIGPTIGGYITDNIGWQWVFYVNIPVGILALGVLLTRFPNIHVMQQGQKSVDWAGAGALIAGITPILLALSLSSTKGFSWTSGSTIGLLAFGIFFLAAFLVIEARTKEPIIPLDLFKNRIFTLSVITVFLTGIGMFGSIINIPLFIQGVQHDSATNSGNSILPMMIGMVIVSITSGQVLSRTGKYRILGIAGMTTLTIGMFLLSTMQVDTQRWQTIAYMVLMGLGLGVAMPLYTLVVQNAFPVQRLGVVTSATTFFRSIGGTVGVAVLGTVVNNRFSSEYVSHLNPALASNPQFSQQLSNLSPQELISPQAIQGIQQALQAQHVPANLIPGILQQIQAPIAPALAAATTQAFFIGGIVLAVAIVATTFIPEIALRKSAGRPGMAMEGAEGLAVEEVSREFAEEGMLVPTAITAEAEEELITADEEEPVPVGGAR